MSIWGGITGGLLGFVVLGPIGALVGSVIGSNLSSRGLGDVYKRQKAPIGPKTTNPRRPPVIPPQILII